MIATMEQINELNWSTIPKANQMAKEIEAGNSEYKLKLTNLTVEQLTHRISQLAWRLRESCEWDEDWNHITQTAIYHIGVEDNGTPTGMNVEELHESLKNMEQMAKVVGCNMRVNHIYAGLAENCYTAEVIFERIENLTTGSNQVRVVLTGDVNAGKSTLLAHLITGNLDNGHGLLRTHICRHFHELEQGNTTSASQYSIYFDESSNVVSKHSKNSKLGCNGLRVVNVLDLGGHRKYLHNTLQGMTSNLATNCCLCIPMNEDCNGVNINSTTLQHMAISFALKLRTIVVITKVDQSATSIGDTNKIIMPVKFVLSQQGKKSMVISNVSDVDSFVKHNYDDRNVIPIILTSSVTGMGLELIKRLFYLIPNGSESCVATAHESNNDDNSTMVRVSAVCYLPSHKDAIFIGTVNQGTMTIGEEFYMGPTSSNSFMKVVVRSLRVDNIAVSRVKASQCFTFTVESNETTAVDESAVGRPIAGMILARVPLQAVHEFCIKITLVSANCKIKKNYECVLHCNGVRQTIRVKRVKRASVAATCEANHSQTSDDQEELGKVGDIGYVECRFISRTEYLEVNGTVLLVDDQIRALGHIVSISSFSSSNTGATSSVVV